MKKKGSSNVKALSIINEEKTEEVGEDDIEMVLNKIEKDMKVKDGIIKRNDSSLEDLE